MRDACRSRSISPIHVRTPLLVPSFSSRGFQDLSEIYQLVRDYLFDVSLVSAYDIHYGRLELSEIYSTDTVFLDSGGYEARASIDPSEPYVDPRSGQVWHLDDYINVLSNLNPYSRLVVVSFDFAEPSSIATQAIAARSLFSRYPEFAGNFLCKPESDASHNLEIASLVQHIDELAAFDLIGVTEKELGHTVLERCRGILQIRGELHRRGYQTPIHVFGCLDPITILAYFVCGADVFDGLAWIRFAIVRGTPMYHATSAILSGSRSVSDLNIVVAHRIENLNWLRLQARAMRSYCDTYSLEEFSIVPGAQDQLVKLVQSAGLEF